MRAIFLDRDGVINKYPGDGNYVTSCKRFKFLPNVKKAIARLKDAKFQVFVISNQAGVSKGTYSAKTLSEITKKMLDGLKKAGAEIDGVFYCIHRKEEGCACRKPKAGLIEQAIRDKQINLRKSYFIGDSIIDMQAAKTAGCKKILVFSGKERPANHKNWEIQPDYTFKNLYEAVNWLVKS